MKVVRGYRYRLSPLPEQSALFRQYAGASRFIYNIALEQRRIWWRQFKRNTGRNIGAASQSSEVSELRREVDWLASVPRACLEQSIRDLDTAFTAFFAGRAKHPRPKRRGENESFYFQGRDIKLKKLNSKWSSVRLPKIGFVKFRSTRECGGIIKNAVVSSDVSGWYISFACERELHVDYTERPAIGIDRGVTTALALSTGEMLTVPATLDQLEAQKRKTQRIVSRRKRGSNRRAKAQRRASRLQARQARIRRDFHHRAALNIAERFGVVVLEKLETKRMTASASRTVENPGRNVRQKAGLNRAILNVGWHQFATILTYKVEERGGQVITVPAAYSSQTCSACGVIDARSRESQAVFQCVSCGHRAHADTNAAIEILRRGNTSLLRVEGSGCGPVEARTLAVREHGLNLALTG